MVMVGWLALFLSMFLYNMFLKDWECRTMIISALFVNAVGSATTILYTRNITFGLSPIAFVFLTTTITDTLSNAYKTLPILVVFAKLIPENVESSMFAFISGLSNLASNYLAKELALVINSFVGCYYISSTENNLSTTVWELYTVQLCCTALPLLFIWMLPTKA